MGAKVFMEAATAGAVEGATALGYKSGMAAFEAMKKSYDVGTAITQSAGTVTQAGANLTAAEKAADAQQMDVDAKRLRLMAEMFQEQLEEENAIIEMIVESKNKAVENVIKMMNAAFGTSQKIMAAGMAK
jgi:nitrogenase molybdenum-iron protein alpha/beta subunit